MFLASSAASGCLVCVFVCLFCVFLREKEEQEEEEMWSCEKSEMWLKGTLGKGEIFLVGIIGIISSA